MMLSRSSPDLIRCIYHFLHMILKVICAGVGFGSGTETNRHTVLTQFLLRLFCKHLCMHLYSSHLMSEKTHWCNKNIVLHMWHYSTTHSTSACVRDSNSDFLVSLCLQKEVEGGVKGGEGWEVSSVGFSTVCAHVCMCTCLSECMRLCV